MTRRLLVLALLGAAFVPVAAHAGGSRVTLPIGCSVEVWVPDIHFWGMPPGPFPGFGPSGDTGANTDCP